MDARLKRFFSVFATTAAVAVSIFSNRITEAGDTRITEAGDTRITY